MKRFYTNHSVCDSIIDEFNALVDAMDDICDPDTVQMIQARKEVILKK